MLGSALILAALTALAVAACWAFRALLAPRLSPGPAGAAVWFCRILLAAVFLAAAYGKLRDPYAFAVSIHAYRLIPDSWAPAAAVIMPAVETVAALALVTGVLWRGASVLLGGMLVIFLVALAQAILRGIDIDCGCFGKGSSEVSFWLIARNYGLLLCALLPLALDRRRSAHGRAPIAPALDAAMGPGRPERGRDRSH